MGLQFEQSSAHFAHFMVAMIVLASRLYVDWWTNSSQLGQLTISRFPCVNVKHARSAKNIAAVRDSFLEKPRLSIPRRALGISLSQTTAKLNFAS